MMPGLNHTKWWNMIDHRNGKVEELTMIHDNLTSVNDDTEKTSFIDSLNTIIAYEQIRKDRTLNLTREQHEEVDNLKNLDLNGAIRNVIVF